MLCVFEGAREFWSSEEEDPVDFIKLHIQTFESIQKFDLPVEHTWSLPSTLECRQTYPLTALRGRSKTSCTCTTWMTEVDDGLHATPILNRTRMYPVDYSVLHAVCTKLTAHATITILSVPQQSHERRRHSTSCSSYRHPKVGSIYLLPRSSTLHRSRSDVSCRTALKSHHNGRYKDPFSLFYPSHQILIGHT